MRDYGGVVDHPEDYILKLEIDKYEKSKRLRDRLNGNTFANHASYATRNMICAPQSILLK